MRIAARLSAKRHQYARREPRDIAEGRIKIYIFAKFQVLAGTEGEAGAALEEVLGPTRNEPGCLSIHAFRALRDGSLFYIHSKGRDEQAFEVHARRPHTVRLRERLEACIDHPFEVTRTQQIG